jgi:cholesterol transport system auxiliary component
MKRLSIALAAALLAVACASPGRGSADIALYDLGAPAAVSPGAAAAHAGIALEVRMPAWLDGAAIYYRLDYADPQRLQQYSRARWVGPLAPLLQQRMRQSLAIAPGGAPCTLRIEVDEFIQRFSSPDESRAELRGEALLVGKGRALIARLPLQLKQSSRSADAAGGAGALSALGDTASAALADWLRQQDLANCRSR